MVSDLVLVLRWWGVVFVVGIVAWPIVRKVFSGWYDEGYVLAKAFGLGIVSYLVYLLGTLHVLPFGKISIFVSLALLLGVGLWKGKRGKVNWRLIVLEELVFGGLLLFWAWIKAHEPSIHGLEKFMDFGFMKSVLESKYFPVRDVWLAGKNYINYYYFGHLTTAVLTKLSGIDLAYSFNLMLAGLFAFTATMSFGIAYQLIKNVPVALLTAYIITLGGNLQTIYAFTSGYAGEGSPPQFWKIFTGKLDPGYWYANATRFIPYTIHEFPSYSFVVSDVHGHVLSLPFVLLALAMVVNIFKFKKDSFWLYGLYGFWAGILLMTNALDGPVYLGLLVVLLFIRKWRALGLVVGIFLITALPFLIYFKSFVTGVAINCPFAALANTRIGPILFEGIEKCQRSPMWMLFILWGFFWYCGAWFLAKIKDGENWWLGVMFLFATGLVLFAEFFYFKDIYPAHFRSNTMFKLGYQAFIMFGFIVGFTIYKLRSKWFYLGLLPLLFLVVIYPFFSVRSYFNGLKNYEGLSGLEWLARQYPDDYKAIKWLGNNTLSTAIIVEAAGDSYTDYARISTFTGRQTIVGWGVHEWLWRNGYDMVASRQEEVRKIYESVDEVETGEILNKYGVGYVVLGDLERKKYVNLDEGKWIKLGEVAFRAGSTVVIRIRR